MVESWCEAADDHERKLPTGAVTRSPPEGTVDHTLEKADQPKGGILFMGYCGRFKPREVRYFPF